ncbi:MULTISPECIES: ABC transporter substrate-binding protein [unclassified Sphingomonas]|uniref:ABC transporter substrate-binding protein n=1 Tax=unclassified Sphingomonas TaxID=196159 RepID=UPI00226A7264|nr:MULTISPECIES: ABC transporter substrate-binding protein [unclassified Sphingomonas]
MRALGALLLLGACGPVPAAPPPRAGAVPMRIVSTNPCADAVLMRLVPPARIAAISHYSQEPSATSIPVALARRFRGTEGTAEEVIALHPDLVITSSFTPMATKAAYARAGLHTLVLNFAPSIADSEAQVMQIAEATGTRAAGRALNAEIDRTVASVARHDRRPTALLYISGELATGPGTLLDDMMTHAGFANAATRHGLTHTGRLSGEALVMDPPAIIIAPDGPSRGAAMRRALLKDTRHAWFARDLINCGGPVIVPALRRLAAIRATLS